MGSRHNRKRTRSRPRNRNSIDLRTSHYRAPNSHTISPSLSSYSTPLTTSPTNRSANHWHGQHAAWQERLPTQHQQQQRQQQQLLQLQEQKTQKAQSDALRLRIFGGEAGGDDDDSDEASLCEPMLRVVMHLFEGEVDYVDP